MNDVFGGITSRIYGNNMFRILGIASDASPKAGRRRMSTLVSLLDTGEQTDLAEELLGGFAPSPDESDVRLASQMLENPAERLVHEVHWFHPSDDGLATHRMDAALVRGWEDEEAFGTPQEAMAARHNLAIFYQLCALRVDSGVKAVDDKHPKLSHLRRDSDAAWGQALQRWAELARDEEFVEWATGRFDAVARSRLDAQWGAQFIGNLAAGALFLILQQIYSFDEMGKHDDARRLTALLGRTGFGRDYRKKAAEEFFAPKYEQFLRMIEQARLQRDESGPDTLRRATEFLDNIEPAAKFAKALLGHNHHFASGLGNELVTLGNQAQIKYTDDDTTDSVDPALAMLRRIAPLAASSELKITIGNNIDILSCHFCSKAERNGRAKGQEYVVNCCKIDSVDTLSGNVKFTRTELGVPCCKSCSGTHEQALKYKSVKEKLESGWTVGSEPSQTHIDAFLRRNRGY